MVRSCPELYLAFDANTLVRKLSDFAVCPSEVQAVTYSPVMVRSESTPRATPVCQPLVLSTRSYRKHFVAVATPSLMIRLVSRIMHDMAMNV